MPICPFCHKPVTSAFTVWCGCGTNLSSYPSLPDDETHLKDWLKKHEPKALETEKIEGDLLEQARAVLIKDQENVIDEESQKAYEIAQVKQLLQEFLSSCSKEELPPNIDIGKLRKERFKEQKKAKQSQNMPVKNFRLTPGFHFQIFFSRSVEDFYLTQEGELYRHHMSVVDPYPVEELLKFTTLEKINEGLRRTLVDMLKQRQIKQSEVVEES